MAGGATRRIVYVADTSCYGAVGPRPITEDERPRLSAWGHCLTPALERLDGYLVAGLPIVTALPGWVYGNGSWFRERVIEPVMAGRRVLQFGKAGPWMSPIHVHDCARALVHLAEHGVAGGRYFVVNSEPIQMHEFAATFARLANRPLRVARFHKNVAGGRVLYGVHEEQGQAPQGGFKWSVAGGGEDLLVRAHLGMGMVITHDCEIENDPSTRTLAMIRPISDLDPATQERVFKGEVYSAFPLEAQEQDPKFGRGFIDFRRITTVRADVLDASVRVASASDELRKAIAERFWDYLYRRIQEATVE